MMEEMHRRTLELSERVLGKEHPHTVTSIYCLAYLLQNWKRYDSSSVLYQRALLGYQKTLGLDHPTTLACSEHYTSATVRDNDMNMIIYVRMMKNESYGRLYI
jgi:hypothetical protein